MLLLSLVGLKVFLYVSLWLTLMKYCGKGAKKLLAILFLLSWFIPCCTYIKYNYRIHIINVNYEYYGSYTTDIL